MDKHESLLETRLQSLRPGNTARRGSFDEFTDDAPGGIHNPLVVTHLLGRVPGSQSQRLCKWQRTAWTMTTALRELRMAFPVPQSKDWACRLPLKIR